MRTTRLVAASALSALLLLPMGTAAKAPQGANVAPAAGFTATITTKANTKTRTATVKVSATSIPSGKSVTGYFLSENPTANPTGATGGWKVQPTTFTLADLDGSHTIYVWAKTNSQVSARGQAVTFLDRVTPTVSAFDVTPTSSSARTVAVTFSSADAGGAAASGIVKYAVVNGTSAPAATATAWVGTAPTSVKLTGANGLKTVSAFVRDAAGNVSAAGSDTVTLAMPAPSVTLTLPAYTKSQTVTVKLVFVDGAGAGLSGYILKETNSAPAASSTAWLASPGSFKLSTGQGTKTVYAWAKDKAGNVSAVSSATTTWDATAPTASLTITTVSPTSSVNINVTASGNALGGSPIAKYAIVDGTTAPTLSSDWKDTAPTTFKLKTGNGVHSVSLFVKDAAGNISAANTKTITLTPPPPTVVVDVVPLNTNKLTVPIAVDTTDPSGTGIKGYFLQSTATPVPTASTSGWKLVTSTFAITGPDGIKTVYAWVKDGNGTVSAVSSDTVRLDTTVPVATVTVTGSPGVSPVVTISGTDTSGSGVTAYAFTLTNTQPDKNDSLAWYANATDASNALSLAQGTQTVYGWVKDAAGNISVTVAGTSTKSVTKS